MHKRFAEVIGHADEARGALHTMIASAPIELLHERPAPDDWSVVEILDHLRLIDLSVAKVVARVLTAARAAGVPAEQSDSSVLHALDGFGVRGSSRKQVSPTFATPRRDVGLPTVLDDMRAAREVLRAAIATGEGLDLTLVRTLHPALGEIDLYQWVLFVAHHDVRHTKQIARVLERLVARQHGSQPHV